MKSKCCGNGRYLGLPENVGRKKKEIFRFIVEKVQQRIQDWSHRFLSEVGKKILLKTVAMALHVYTMNCFKLSKGTCDDINRITAEYWWSKGSGKRSMHWLSWKRLGLPKKEGDLGFRDIKSFNIAMLGKQVWRILQSPNSLVSRVLKSRYFASSSILDANLGRKHSFIRSSLFEGRNLVKKGLRILIGNGSETSLWSDPWLSTNPSRSPQPIAWVQHDFQVVSDLMNAQHNMWDFDKLTSAIVTEDREHIQRIRLSSQTEHDLIGWHYTSFGFYTVKSGYRLAMHSVEDDEVLPPHGLPEFKERIWKLKTAPKIKHFLWRILSNVMAIGNSLVQQGIISDLQCRRCCKEEKSNLHLFFNCEYVQAIWQGARLPNLELIDPNASFETKFRVILDSNSNTNFSPL